MKKSLVPFVTEVSEETEKKESSKLPETTRRDFLKGTSAAIILASGLFSVDVANASTRNKASIPKATKFLVYDPALCTGCSTCQMVCSTLWNNGKASIELSRIRVSRDPFGTNDDNYSPNPCLQCVDAPCLRACPVGAITVDRKSGTNARIVDEKKCKGLKTCIDACPYEEKRIAFDKVRNKAFKCHLCNGDPKCVKWCPNGALRFSGPPEFAPLVYYMPEVTKKPPMVADSYMIKLEEDRKKELGYPREEE